jgi:hypothetical protein
MEICHDHNLNRDLTVPKPYGIRVTLRPNDTFARVLGTDWQRLHWYATREERDAALEDMASEHLYSRRGDRPTLIFEPIERDG